MELLEAGITPEEIAHRVRIGGLIVELRGVYRVGHRAPSVEARYMAAIKACGAGARLSGLAAAHLFELLRGAARLPRSPPRRSGGSGRQDPSVARHGSARRHQMARHPGHDRATHARGPVLRARWTPWPALAIRRGSVTARRRPRSRPPSRAAAPPRAPETCAASSTATSTSRSARSNAASWSSSARTTCRSPRPTVPPPAALSTAAGPHTGSPSSSTATATTARATRGNRTAAASERPTPVATSTAAARTETCSSSPRRCSPSCARSSAGLEPLGVVLVSLLEGRVAAEVRVLGHVGRVAASRRSSPERLGHAPDVVRRRAAAHPEVVHA